MDCPRCMDALVAKWAGDVEIDVCLNGCGGWWLDRGELRKLAARGHTMGPKPTGGDGGGGGGSEPPGMPAPLGGFADGPPAAKGGATGGATGGAAGGAVGFGDSPRPSYAPTKMRCPRDGAVLREVLVGGSAAITVDRCIGCGGFWIDHGELDRIVELVGDRAAEPGRDIEKELGSASLLSDTKGGSLFGAVGGLLEGDFDGDERRRGDARGDRSGDVRGDGKRQPRNRKRSFFEMVGELLEEVVDL